MKKGQVKNANICVWHRNDEGVKCGCPKRRRWYCEDAKTCPHFQNMRKTTWIERERRSFRGRIGMTYEESEKHWYAETMAGHWIKQWFINEVIRMSWLECCWRETGIHPETGERGW